jgi:hypothetical protein
VDAPTKLEFFTQDNTTTDVMSTVGATLTLGGDDQNATFAGKVAISSDFNAGELLGVKGSAGSEWGARIDNTSSTGYGALVKSGGTSSSQLLFQVRGGSVNALTIRGDSSSTFAGDVTVSKSGNAFLNLTSTGQTDYYFMRQVIKEVKLTIIIQTKRWSLKLETVQLLLLL